MILKSLRARQPGKPLWRIVWWYFLHSLSYVWVGGLYRFRVWGLHHVPDSGPVLLVCNHQSFLDPILVGVACHHRQFYAMARSTLFTNPMFSWLIRSLNSIPVERGASDSKSIRRCIEVMSQGHALLVFPEGTRTSDGRLAEFKSGVTLLAKRAGATVVPVAVEGAFEVWGKGQKLPKLSGRIGIEFGEPIRPGRLVEMGSAGAAEYLHEVVKSLRASIRVRLDGADRGG